MKTTWLVHTLKGWRAVRFKNRILDRKRIVPVTIPTLAYKTSISSLPTTCTEHLLWAIPEQGFTRWMRHSSTSHGVECLGRDTDKWTSNMDDSILTEGYGHLARHKGQKRILIESDILWWLFFICPQIYLSFYCLEGWLLTDFINQAPLPLWLPAGSS